MTLIETAKLSGLNPQVFLADVLARINDHLLSRLDELLPWNTDYGIENLRELVRIYKNDTRGAGRQISQQTTEAVP